MGATKQDKIDSISTKASGQFKVPVPPKVADDVTTYGLKEGLKKFDEKLIAWARDLEKSINERIVKADDVSSGPPG